MKVHAGRVIGQLGKYAGDAVFARLADHLFEQQAHSSSPSRSVLPRL